MALVTCPRCGSYCCPACWQGLHRLCHACLQRSPIDPVPWEQPGRFIVSRWFWTMATAIQPRATAASFSTASPKRAAWFTLLSMLPVAALAGVIPFTHTLQFGNRWQVALLHEPTQNDIALDVLRAMGMGVGLAVVELALVALVTVGLLKLWLQSTPWRPHLAALLYRGWLLPAGGVSGLVIGITIWGFPENLTDWMRWLAGLASIAPLLLLTGSLISTARQASGIGPLKALVVGLFPIVVLLTAEPLLFQLLAPLLPHAAAAP